MIKGSGGEVLPVYSNPRVFGADSAADNRGTSWQPPLAEADRASLAVCCESVGLEIL